MRKFDYLYVLQGDYGHGWEDLTAEDKSEPGALRLAGFHQTSELGLRFGLELEYPWAVILSPPVQFVIRPREGEHRYGDVHQRGGVHPASAFRRSS